MTDTMTRHAELRRMLDERRRDLQSDLQSRIRDERGHRSTDGRDDLEHTEADVQGDLTFALLRMRADTMTRIDEAIKRIDDGQYGACFDCGGQVSARRLRAMPFAVRCQSCEGRREQERTEPHRLIGRPGALFTAPDGARN